MVFFFLLCLFVCVLLLFSICNDSMGSRNISIHHSSVVFVSGMVLIKVKVKISHLWMPYRNTNKDSTTMMTTTTTKMMVMWIFIDKCTHNIHRDILLVMRTVTYSGLKSISLFYCMRAYNKFCRHTRINISMKFHFKQMMIEEYQMTHWRWPVRFMLFIVWNSHDKNS